MLYNLSTEVNFKDVINLLHGSAFYYIICANMQGNYSYINKHYAEKFANIESELVGKPYYITMHPDDRKVCEEVSQKCFENPDKSFPATIRKHNGQGGFFITQWEYRVMVEHGEITGIFCLGYDITEIEQQKQHVNILNEDLNTAQEVIHQNSRKLDEIAFAQAHLVRAPLSNILGIVSILQNLTFDKNTESLINMLQESCDKLDSEIKAIVNKTY